MSNTSRDSAVAALTKLEEFRRKWELVKVERRKEKPVGLKTSLKKGVRTAKQVVVEKERDESYLNTRDRAMSIAANMFIDEFAPLASLIAKDIGIAKFSDVPQEPPCPVQVLGHGRAALALTGTHDTSEAGRRILAWGAMAHSPARWHRAENFYIAVAKWAESLVYDTSPGKAWRLLHKPIQWAVDFAVDAAKRHSPKTPDTNDSGKLPELDPVDALILRHLLSQFPIRVTQEALAYAIVKDGKTIRPALKKLGILGYIAGPPGKKRRGSTLTPKGKALAESLPKIPA